MVLSDGKLIVFEGIDGAGTTSQISRAAEFLSGHGFSVYTTAEPSTGYIGKKIREILQGAEEATSETLALLFAADRLHHVASEIGPKLEEGCIVLSDRYLLSSLAYQGMDNPMEWVATLNAKARRPDLNIYFRIAPATAVARVKARGGPEEIFDAQAKQEKIAEAYEVVAARTDIGMVRVVDAEASMDEVSSAINALLRECLGLAE